MRVLGVKTNLGGQKIGNSILMEKLVLFYEKEYKPLLNHIPTNLTNTTQLIRYISTQIHTSISNNVQEHFIDHFKRFVNKTLPTLDRSTSAHLKHQILSMNTTPSAPEPANMVALATDPEDIVKWKSTHLIHILPDCAVHGEITKSVYYDVKANPLKFLKGMLYMNEVLEKDGHKLFQPIPLRTNIIPKHITFDTVCLIDLLYNNIASPDSANKSTMRNNVNQYKGEIWGNFLNLKHKVFKDKYYQFHHQIQTDGLSCSLLFVRKDQASDKKWGSKVTTVEKQEFHRIEELTVPQLDALKDRNIVGCDPGKKSLVYMLDENGKTLQYTAHQRKCESYGKRNERILCQMKKRHGIHEKELLLAKSVQDGICSGSSVNVEKFKKYLVEKDKLNNEVGNFYKVAVWRKMKFRQYSYGEKSIDTFLNKIKDTFGANCLIGYGNWSTDKQMKHSMPTMNKGLRRKIHKRFDTITIDEHRTSMLCCDCSSPLIHYRDKKNKEVYRLFCCVSCKNKETVFRSRDSNAAVNIRKLTRAWIDTQSRPIEFSRCSFVHKTEQQQALSLTHNSAEGVVGKRETIVVTALAVRTTIDLL